MTFAQAAAVPMAALTALQGLRDKGHIRAGQKVLVNGASGGVGTFAVQLAKVFGAEVTAVCSGGNVDKARSLGADHVIDYSKEDFTKSGKQYDLILGANGFHPLADYKRALAPGGAYVMTGGSMKQIFQAMLLAPWHSMTGGKKLGGITAHANQKDLLFMKELMEAGRMVPLIDRIYPLAEVPEALRYLLAGHAKGKVVIKIGDAA
jgi:NADPH:quinone reductase-like Zn-dependent oxidoreductase